MDRAAGLLEQNRLFADLLRGADWSTPVPTCPGWTLTQIFRHVGRSPRWAYEIVRTRAGGYIEPRSVPGGKPPADRDGAIAWFQEGPRLVVEAVAADPDVTVWTTIGPRPARWWVRRLLHEAVVHRADAALALGVDYQVEPAIAADGISEWLGLVSTLGGTAMLPDGATLQLKATDDGLGAGGEWTARGGPERISWEHGPGPGDVEVRATAADLLLALMRRMPADDPRLAVTGDPERWTTWLTRTDF